MKRFLFSLFVFVLFCATVTAQLPDGFIRERIATGLNPTSMSQAPDGRIFITEKDGTITVIRDEEVLADPLIVIDVDDSNERGLGHMVLHPDFEMNGYFYVYYSVQGRNFNRISRFTANGDKAIPGSELILMDLDPMGADIHNGGAMRFGLDGFLYVSTGDGGENWRSEDIEATGGKILRFNDDGQPVADNPWFNVNEGKARFVYATGLRNPFTMTMHPVTGEMFVNDVGGSKFEEVNRIIRGGFYGWPVLEGKRTGQNLPDEYVDPVFSYAHANNYCSIVGSAFYFPQQPQFPEEYTGIYFYSDYCTGHIRMLEVETGNDKGIFMNDGDRVIDLMVSPDGSLFYLERKGIGDGSPEDNTGTNQGTLWKISYTGTGAPFISLQPEAILVSEGEDAEFKIGASGAQPLEFRWYVNGIEVTSGPESFLHLDNLNAAVDSSTVHAIVSNSAGEAYSDTVLLRVTTNRRPTAEIVTPLSEFNYTAGDTIQFSGTATDTEDGNLQPSSFSWKIDFHHGIHTHPAMPWTAGITAGEWIIPTLGETSTDVWYRVYLKVTDSYGLSEIVHRDIYPLLGIFNVQSVPAGLQIALDGSPMTTPYMIEGVRGIRRFLTAPEKQVKGDSIYFFQEWNDGSIDLNKEITTDHNAQAVTGIFKSYVIGKGSGLTASYFDNPNLNGQPVVVLIDSILNDHYHFSGPQPSLPDDYFSIRWDGFIQAYKTGIYTFTVIADDGVRIEIDDMALIDEWNPGIHFVTASRFLEQGRLYPIRIRMFDELYSSQFRLRWSSPGFSEEVVPASQLYPADYLSASEVSGIASIESISSRELRLMTESYKDVILGFSITSSTGQTFPLGSQHIALGKNIISFDISHLVPGIYFLTVIKSETGEQDVLKFVKAR